MPQETKSIHTGPEQIAPPLQGIVVSSDDKAALLGALADAFDYRGDVTLTLDDQTEVSGYIFDRYRGDSLDDSYVRVVPAASDERLTIAFSTIVRVAFTGRDTAAGKSFETWIKKYTEKKMAGQEANIFTDNGESASAS